MTEVTTAARRRSRRPLVAAAIAMGTAGAFAALPLTGQAANTAPGFTHSLVSSTLAGGEPLVQYYSNATNGADLAYTSHEGTTHLFRDGLIAPDTTNFCSTPQVPPQTTPSGFVCSYTNQVNVWTSTDNGATWQQTTVVKNGAFTTGPTSAFGLGFSDPDWTADEGGYLYNTGIDLANDAVFASTDGGRSFPIGNNNCHGGDRPWLAGGAPGEVFLATDTTADPNTQVSSGHELFRGAVTGTAPAQTLVCSGVGGQPDPSGTSVGIQDFGAWQGTGSYSAADKVFYVHNAGTYHGALIDPAIFNNANSSSGVGISILRNAAAAFAGGTVTAFTEHYEVPMNTGIFAHWPSIAIDSNNIVYLTWDTTEGGSSALNNSIQLATIDLKAATPAFSAPITITRPGKSVMWPWVAAANGNASVVWYQYDSVTNPDQTTTGNISLLSTNVFGAATATPALFGPVDAVGAPIHVGGTCQSGTTCVATGQDRRLGDFFTNSLDKNGCVLIASGTTTPATGGDTTGATARPLFVRQNSGTSLTGLNCAALATNVAEVPATTLLALGGLAATTVALIRRRHRRLAA